MTKPCQRDSAGAGIDREVVETRVAADTRGKAREMRGRVVFALQPRERHSSAIADVELGHRIALMAEPGRAAIGLDEPQRSAAADFDKHAGIGRYVGSGRRQMRDLDRPLDRGTSGDR